MAKKVLEVDTVIPVGCVSVCRVVALAGDECATFNATKSTLYLTPKELRKVADSLIKAAQLLEGNRPN